MKRIKLRCVVEDKHIVSVCNANDIENKFANASEKQSKANTRFLFRKAKSEGWVGRDSLST